jgi:hypothetical protein
MPIENDAHRVGDEDVRVRKELRRSGEKQNDQTGGAKA